MVLRNYLLALLGLVLIGSSCLIAKNCKNKQNCLNNKSCKCYCSRVCHFRKKEADDKPVFVENDPRGFGCYCKQWDLDNVDKCD